MSIPVQSYAFTVEVTVAAARHKVWKAFTRKTADWWPKTFFSLSATKRFVIEGKLGGLAYEDCGKKTGAVWGTVIGWLPEEKITFAFEMYPGWSGPGRSLVSIAFSDVEGGTQLVLEDHGVCPHADKAATSLKEGWQALLGTHLKEFVEGVKAKKEKKPKKVKKPKTEAEPAEAAS